MMDAVKFLREKNRMCKTHGCIHCPMGRIKRNDYKLCADYIRDCPEQAVAIVERWSSEHPIVTNRQKMKEIFGKSIPNVFLPELSDALELKSWLDAEYKEQEDE